MKTCLLTVALAAALVTVAPGQAKPAAAPAATELDQLLAPIALYPDSLLAQMLICSSKPAALGALSEWLRSQQVEGSALQDAATAAGFEPSYVALAIFPDVVNAMVTQMDRTTKIGQAFAADRSAVFESIQRLRAKAKAAGTLKTTPQQQVETKTTSSGEQVIVIEPSNPQVVYVPQYNPTVVYAPPTTSTVVVQEDSHSDAAAAGIIGFTAGIAIGAAIDNNYYYGPYGWHGGGYMYNDAWDDYYDAREDARDDWMDHREDMAENRGDYARDTQEQRTERQQNRQDTRTNAQSERTERRANAQSSGQSATQATASQATTSRTSQESRGYGSGAAAERSGTKSDAFSGYSSGKSERAASQRGQRSRSSSRSGGGSRRR